MSVLYQFAGSHFCEKARWALDYKEIDFEVKNLVPGPHLRTTKKLCPNSSLPIWVDGETTVQGSAEIISHLDKQFPHPPLTPTNSQEASIAHEWERYLDRNLGVPLRLFFYEHTFKNRVLATEFLLHDTPWWGRGWFALTFPGLKRVMKRRMNISAESAIAARTQMLEVFDKLEERIAAHRFLAGSMFSRADLTVAALLFHFWSDNWPAVQEVKDLQEEIKDRPAYAWAADIYQDHRRSKK